MLLSNDAFTISIERMKRMNQSNVAVIQNIYDAFNRGELDAVLANVEPNAEWIDYGPSSVPYFGDFTGRITDFFQAIGQSVTNGHVTVNHYIEADDRVITEARWTATVKDNGARIDAPIAHIFTLRDGKVSSWRGYADTAAVAAAHAANNAT